MPHDGVIRDDAGERMFPESPLELLPHRPPFLFIDRIVDAGAGRARAVVTFPRDAWFFAGHFPDNPVVPGVIVLEALAQLAGIAGMFPDDPESGIGDKGFLAQVRDARFRAPIGPDQEIELEATLIRRMRTLFMFETVARRGEQVLVEAQLTLAQS